MPRDWSRESWHKTFAREPSGWASMSFDARGLYRLLQDEATRDGVVDLGERPERYVEAVYRMDAARARAAIAELNDRGFIETSEDGWVLPIHREQQASLSSSTERVQRYRERKRNAEALHVTPTVSVKPIDRIDRLDKKDKKRSEQNARAREQAAAAPVEVDPKVAMLAEKLSGAKRFTHLATMQVAEALVGKLGASAWELTESKADDAIAAASLEVEDGANERRLRQVLGWKLVDAMAGKRPNGKAPHMVQGLGPGETMDDFVREAMERNRLYGPG